MQVDVGRQIRRAREAQGLSQVALAAKLEVAERTVQTWEANERMPRQGALLALAAALDVSPAFFYGSDELKAAA